MSPEKAKELVEAFAALTREIVGQEMAKNGVIGKFPENFKPAIDRFKTTIAELLSN